MADQTLIIITGVSATAAIAYYIKNSRKQKQLEELNSKLEKLKQDLHHLEIENASSKLNPHLLKNTLNTIHFFSWQTTSAIEKLSEMLSYILHESNKKYVTLQQELDFLNAYYQVHKLKLAPQTKVNFQLVSDPKASQLKIAPLITINFIENAFVHGDYTLTDASLDINVSLSDNILKYSVTNTFTPGNKQPGIGYHNFKKRLELLHKDAYQLSTNPSEKTFTATLNLRLNAN